MRKQTKGHAPICECPKRAKQWKNDPNQACSAPHSSHSWKCHQSEPRGTLRACNLRFLRPPNCNHSPHYGPPPLKDLQTQNHSETTEERNWGRRIGISTRMNRFDQCWLRMRNVGVRWRREKALNSVNGGDGKLGFLSWSCCRENNVRTKNGTCLIYVTFHHFKYSGIQ